MSQGGRKHSPPRQQVRLYEEALVQQDPIPFVTARRFWLLVYMLLGSTGLAMVIARFLVRPWVVRVNTSRGLLQSHIHEQMTALVSNVAKSITTLPGRQIIVDTNRHRLYVNTETQTDSENVTPDLPAPEEESPTEMTNFQTIQEKLHNIGQQEEERLYDELSSKMVELRSYLHDLDLYQYKTSYNGFGSGSTGTSTGFKTEAIQKVKAEIRSVKGSLLNARTFTSVQQRT